MFVLIDIPTHHLWAQNGNRNLRKDSEDNVIASDIIAEQETEVEYPIIFESSADYCSL